MLYFVYKLSACVPDSRFSNLWVQEVVMEKGAVFFYLVVGFGLLFFLPFAESLDKGLYQIATVLILGYWGMIGLCFLALLVTKFIDEYDFGNLLYNIWFFASLMCVAIGILAIVDDGAEKSTWAICLILYGGTVGFLKRAEL